MAFRTTAAKVRTTAPIPDNADLATYIEIANQLVTDLIGTAYTDSKLEMIDVLYLAVQIKKTLCFKLIIR